MRTNRLSQSELNQEFSYNPETGELFRKGKKAGTKTSDGYLRVMIKGKVYFAHRIIATMLWGDISTSVVDHINGNGMDNSLGNIRVSTSRENSLNKKEHREGRECGWTVVRKTGKFRSQIRSGRRVYWLGDFETKEAAHACYQAALSFIDMETSAAVTRRLALTGAAEIDKENQMEFLVRQFRAIKKSLKAVGGAK